MARLIAIGSGKGGVGKTGVAANLALALGARGVRVALLDCDFGLANLDIVLGVSPKRTLEDVVAGRSSMREALTPIAENVSLLAGCGGVAEVAGLGIDALSGLGEGLATLASEHDVLLLDTAAGVGDSVLGVLAAADEVLLVVTPEPSSVVDAYATLKMLVSRKPAVAVGCVVNMAPTASEGEALYHRFSAIVRAHLSHDPGLRGVVPLDPAVRKAALSRKPVLRHAPDSAASAAFNTLAARMTPRAGEPLPGEEAETTERLRTGLFGLFRRRAA